MPPAAPLNPESLPLRDIHLPPAVSWWPPAPGWWLLLGLLLLLTVAGFWLWQRWQRRHFQRLALRELQRVQQQHSQQADDRQLLQDLSRLLRQTALLHFPQSPCAGLVGEDWLRFLDQRLDDEGFSQGIGRSLADGPYLPQTQQLDAPALLDLCRRWLRRLPLVPKPVRRQA